MWPGTRVDAENNADILRGKHGLAHSAAFIWLLIMLTQPAIEVRNRLRHLADWLQAPVWDVHGWVKRKIPPVEVANFSLLASPGCQDTRFSSSISFISHILIFTLEYS